MVEKSNLFADHGHILVINPGSTSTKLAIYKFNLPSSLTLAQETILDHSKDGEIKTDFIMEQFEFRYNAVQDFLEKSDSSIELIMARGAPLRPLPGGVYQVDQFMIEDLESTRYSDHASNLGVLIGYRIAAEKDIPIYIADPTTTDEFESIARVSGVPGIERKSRSHALNIKASTRKLCQRLNYEFLQTNWVVCHMGGGISIAALKNGRIIDVNDALLGMGPFSPERAGALPIAGLLDLAFSGDYNRKELESLLSKRSGLQGYLHTSNLLEVEEKLQAGDEKATLIFHAMVYQVAKEIAAMASVLKFELNGILLTGGMANSQLLCDSLSKRIQTLGSVYIEPGENELQALAQAGFRVLQGNEEINTYGPTP